VHRYVVSLAILIGTSLVAVRPSAAATDWTVYLRRSGPVRIGMTLAEVRGALGDRSAYLRGNEPEVPLTECAYVVSDLLPAGLGFMFEQGRVVRIDVYEPGIKTASGAEVGTTEAEILRKYPGRITVEGHQYVSGGHYLTYRPFDTVDKQYEVVFETDGVRVTSFRTGTLAAVALVEGCS
jgi:hypothetical protein